MSRLTVEAHCLDELIPRLAWYGVTLVDRTDEPWAVTFEGPAQRLRDMYEDNWTGSEWPGLDEEQQ